MLISDIFSSNHTAFASFELVPPIKGSDVQQLYGSIDPLMEFQPPFLNVTCHRDEVTYKENGNGTFTKLVLSKRPSTIAIVGSLLRRYKVEIVPHIICGGASKTRIEDELLDLHFLGIRNVMALRGDAIPGQKHFIPDPDGFEHTEQLVRKIQQLNHGEYINTNVREGVTTEFCVGVAGYPEKHFEAANMQTDIHYLKQKVDAGADYIVSQMFFDNEVFYRFVEQCRNAGITVPIIPGLKPISSCRQIDLLPRSFHIDIPQDLVVELRKATTPDDAYQVGIEWCIAQSRDLLCHGVPAIHYYTMAKTDNVCQIVRKVF